MKLNLNVRSLAKRAALGLSVFALALLEQLKTTDHLPRTSGEWGLVSAAALISTLPAGADKTGVGAAVKSALQSAQTVLSVPANARKAAAQAQETALLAKLAPVAEAAAIRAISERTGQFTAAQLAQAAPSPAPAEEKADSERTGTAQASPATVASPTLDAHDDHLIATLENEGGPVHDPFPVVTKEPDGSIEVAS